LPLVLIGTEYGVYATENIGVTSPQWSPVNDNGMANVPVYMLIQQVYNYPGVSNWGVIYAATHGRGIFETGTYMSINDQGKNKPSSKLEVSVYPNPVSDRANIYYTFKEKSKLIINVSVFQEFTNNQYPTPNPCFPPFTNQKPPKRAVFGFSGDGGNRTRVRKNRPSDIYERS